MYDNLTNITKSTDADLQTSENAGNGLWGEVVQDNTSDENKNMLCLFDLAPNPQHPNKRTVNAVFAKYFNNPNYKLFKYNSNGEDITDTVTELNYTDTKTMFGATIAKFDVKRISKFVDGWVSLGFFTGLFNFTDEQKRREFIDKLFKANDITSLSLSDCIMMINPSDPNPLHTDHHISNDNILQYPYFQTVAQDTAALFGGSNTYLMISGKVNFHYFSDHPYPIPSDEVDSREGRYAIKNNEGYLLCRLQWGNQYWNGEKWTGTVNQFKLPYIKEDTEYEERRADKVLFNDNDVINTVDWRIGTTKKGYAVKMPTDYIAEGLPILTVYKPYDPLYETSGGNNKGQHYKLNCTFLKDFKIETVIGDPTYSDGDSSDTVYTNVIDDEFASKMSTITFKVCTWDNKKPNYSCVGYFENGYKHYLDKTFNRVNAQDEDYWVEDASNGLRQEEHLIYKLTKQYSEPAMILDFNLRNDNKIYGLYQDTSIPDKEFIVDSVNIDYKMNKQEIKLVEKK